MTSKGYALHAARRAGERGLTALLAMPLMLALLLTGGCGRDDAATRPGDQLIVAIQDDGQTLDPHMALDAASMRLIENLYSGLLRYTQEYGEYEGDLASEWEISEDGRTYTFTIQPGVRFHSGRALTVEDVVWSLQRIASEGVRTTHLGPVETITAPNPQTVVIQLRQPFAPLLVNLAHPMNAVVDRELTEAGEGLRNAANGTGPFRFVEWRRGQHFVMQRNDDYHVEGLPHLRQVIYQPMDDETARTNALRTGAVDLVLDVPEKDLALLQGLNNLRIDSRQGTFWEYLGLNTRRAPFNDVRARQAVAWAIDRQMLNELVKEGRATPLTGGHIRPGYWAHTDLEIYPRRDLQRARQLLADAGLGDGFAVTLRVGSAFPYQVQAAQVVREQLREVGINVQVEAQESGVFFDALGRGDFDMTLVGWVGFVDPDEWVYDLFHSEGRFNQQGYANPQVDELLEQGRLQMERDQRRRTYAQIQRIVAQEAPMVFLYLNEQTSGYLQQVRGFHVHPTATTLWLRNIELDR